MADKKYVMMSEVSNVQNCGPQTKWSELLELEKWVQLYLCSTDMHNHMVEDLLTGDSRHYWLQ